MILHIVPDDKFIDMAYDMFESVSKNNNEFMVVTKQDKFRYIKTTPITKITPLEFLNKKFTKNLSKYEFVVLHWLDFLKMRLLLNAHKNIKFVWIGWGGDYYNYINLNSDSLLMPKTTLLSKNMLNKDKFNIKSLIKKVYFLNNRDIKAINRINYFAPVLENEYMLMKNSIKDFKPKFIDWNYGTLEDDLIKGYENITINGNNILLGNSATISNNHLEAFDKLQTINIENRKIILPLSYGNAMYGNLILNTASELFGDSINPLIDFMSIEKYLEKISSCSIVIMNHLRQQAVGNIIIMLYLGAKVFLNKENPAYVYLKSHDVCIYSLDELSNDTINSKINDEQINKNKEILKKLWGRKSALNKTNEMINILKANN